MSVDGDEGSLDLTPPHPVDQADGLLRYLHEQFTKIQQRYARVIGAVQITTPATTNSATYVDLAGLAFAVTVTTAMQAVLQLAVTAEKLTAGTGTIALAVDGVVVTATEVTITTTAAYVMRCTLAALTPGDHTIAIQAKSADANDVSVAGLLIGQSFG